MSIAVTDVPDKHRWEARDGDTLAGLVLYRRSDDLVIFTHTEVDDDFAGRGVGGALARAALDAAREQGLRVRPDCPFISEWITRHPDYDDLVVARTSPQGD
jgi:predicted GNAT family acetyltransferase